MKKPESFDVDIAKRMIQRGSINEDITYKKAFNFHDKWRIYTNILLGITFIWNIIEGGISVYFGLNSMDLSLIAFGVDSLIEVLSSGLIIYHVIYYEQHKNKSVTSLFNIDTERKLTLFIGYLLILFCIFALLGSIYRLIYKQAPTSTEWGIIVSTAALVVMTILWVYKTKASVILNSSSLRADAACSFGCIKLSAVLLIGSVVYYYDNRLWFVDSATAIIIGLLVGYEGYETVKNASDKHGFTGGCGCEAKDSWLAKRFKEKLANQSGIINLLKSDKANYGSLKPVKDSCRDKCGNESECTNVTLLKTPDNHGCCGNKSAKKTCSNDIKKPTNKMKNNENGCCNNTTTNPNKSCCDDDIMDQIFTSSDDDNEQTQLNSENNNKHGCCNGNKCE